MQSSEKRLQKGLETAHIKKVTHLVHCEWQTSALVLGEKWVYSLVAEQGSTDPMRLFDSIWTHKMGRSSSGLGPLPYKQVIREFESRPSHKNR